MREPTRPCLLADLAEAHEELPPLLLPRVVELPLPLLLRPQPLAVV